MPLTASERAALLQQAERDKRNRYLDARNNYQPPSLPAAMLNAGRAALNAMSPRQNEDPVVDTLTNLLSPSSYPPPQRPPQANPAASPLQFQIDSIQRLGGEGISEQEFDKMLAAEWAAEEQNQRTWQNSMNQLPQITGGGKGGGTPTGPPPIRELRGQGGVSSIQTTAVPIMPPLDQLMTRRTEIKPKWNGGQIIWDTGGPGLISALAQYMGATRPQVEDPGDQSAMARALLQAQVGREQIASNERMGKLSADIEREKLKKPSGPGVGLETDIVTRKAATQTELDNLLLNEDNTLSELKEVFKKADAISVQFDTTDRLIDQYPDAGFAKTGGKGQVMQQLLERLLLQPALLQQAATSRDPEVKRRVDELRKLPGGDLIPKYEPALLENLDRIRKRDPEKFENSPAIRSWLYQ
jgi:hypothetical protein